MAWDSATERHGECFPTPGERRGGDTLAGVATVNGSVTCDTLACDGRMGNGKRAPSLANDMTNMMK